MNDTFSFTNTGECETPLSKGELYFVSWWNLENLFDIEGSPRRTEKLARTIKKEVKGWSEKILNRKIAQISQIISKMNGSNGPDILGVCEVENRWVIEKLTDSLKHLHQHRYEIVHADTKDDRGIDVAFIYDAKKFEIEKNPTSGEKLIFSHFIMKREATRDILQVNLKTKASDNRLVLIGNHWPSRSGGQYESEPYRMIAGETSSYFHQRILEENNKEEGGNTAILVMGDFNDEPFNRSVTDYLLATPSVLKVKQSKEAPRLFNLMWPIMARGVGTFYYSNFANLLDQFMISKGIVDGTKFKVKVTDIVIFPEMVKGKYKHPVKFGRPSNKSLNEMGFSDHLPISIMVEET
ncbi:MAG: endonuclease/exonuclease/phosphatase family protein [Nitrososphaeraceae archaeon]